MGLSAPNRVLVRARPLHAYRLPDCLGEQSGIGGGILVAIASVAAGAFHVGATDVSAGGENICASWPRSA